MYAYYYNCDPLLNGQITKRDQVNFYMLNLTYTNSLGKFSLEDKVAFFSLIYAPNFAKTEWTNSFALFIHPFVCLFLLHLSHFTLCTRYSRKYLS